MTSQKQIKGPVVTVSKEPYLARHLQGVGVDNLYSLDCLGQGYSMAALNGGMAPHIQWIDSIQRVVKRSFVSNSLGTGSDPTNHGTCIASLLLGGGTVKPGQITVGCASKVENYYHAKIMSDSGMIVLDDVIKALDWLLDLSKQGIGPDFVNMSFGEYFNKPWTDDILGINQRMERLWNEYRTVFFVAASNSGQTTNKVSWLSELPFTITVGAINYNNALGYLSPTSPLVDLVDYGIGVLGYSKNGSGYQSFDGTSQATPIAMSKAVAISSWLTKVKGLPKRSVKENFLAICKTHGLIKDLGTPGQDSSFGLGQLVFK